MPTLLVTQPQPGVTQLTLNRPEKLNAMNAELIEDLHGALDDIATRSRVPRRRAHRRRPRLLRRTRPDRLRHRAGRRRPRPGPSRASRRRPTSPALIPHLRSLPVPVIAAVNGPAAGGGLALALGSDIRIAGASARFNVAFVRVGLSGCDIGVSWLLPRLIGASRAWELMLTGRIIDAPEADHIGLVTRVVPDDELIDSALETAGLIVANSPWGVRMTKEVGWSQLEVGSLQAGIDLENRTQILSSFTGDHREAMAAFFEHRPTSWED